MLRNPCKSKRNGDVLVSWNWYERTNEHKIIAAEAVVGTVGKDSIKKLSVTYRGKVKIEHGYLDSQPLSTQDKRSAQ
jgi:hypothetical protein